jgi:hypothetical protein
MSASEICDIVLETEVKPSDRELANKFWSIPVSDIFNSPEDFANVMALVREHDDQKYFALATMTVNPKKRSRAGRPPKNAAVADGEATEDGESVNGEAAAATPVEKKKREISKEENKILAIKRSLPKVWPVEKDDAGNVVSVEAPRCRTFLVNLINLFYEDKVANAKVAYDAASLLSQFKDAEDRSELDDKFEVPEKYEALASKLDTYEEHGFADLPASTRGAAAKKATTKTKAAAPADEEEEAVIAPPPAKKQKKREVPDVD